MTNIDKVRSLSKTGMAKMLGHLLDYEEEIDTWYCEKCCPFQEDCDCDGKCYSELSRDNVIEVFLACNIDEVSEAIINGTYEKEKRK